jgi:signal transduction histidine kinase
VPRLIRLLALYLIAVVAGGAIALIATETAARDNVYVMWAVLLIVTVALTAGTGPALAAALTSTIGDDVVLTGRLPPPDQWKDLAVFAIVALVVGWLVAGKRAKHLEAATLAAREQQLRRERDAILMAIAHDVRNPLAVIAGSARQGLNDAKGDMRRVLGRIDSAAMQAAHLIESLADLRSIDADEVQLNLRRGDLRRTTEAAIDQMEVLARRHPLNYSGPPLPVVAEFDEARVQRVLQNLIGNAIKFSPADEPIDIELRATPEAARIRVRDRGVGIPEQERSRIFDRGYRASTAEGVPGTGIGLFISAEIVKRHGGAIECAAPPDGGTLMEVRLPVSTRVGLTPEALKELQRDGAWPAAANRPIADGDDRHELASSTGQERLVGAE